MQSNRIETEVEMKDYSGQPVRSNNMVMTLLKCNTEEEWNEFSEYYKSSKQSAETNQEILTKAINLDYPDDRLEALISLGIPPTVQNLREAFKAKTPRQLIKLLQLAPELKDEEYDGCVLSAAASLNWPYVYAYLDLRKSVSTPKFLSAILAEAIKQLDFAETEKLIEKYGISVPKTTAHPTDKFYDVLDSYDVWLEAEIKKNEGDNFLIHFTGWADKWDEWIDVTKSHYRFEAYQTLSKGLVASKAWFINWQLLIRKLFLSAGIIVKQDKEKKSPEQSAEEFNFVTKHLVEFIDTNDIHYLQKLLKHSLECESPIDLIELLLSLKAIASERECDLVYSRRDMKLLKLLLVSNEKINAAYVIAEAKFNSWTSAFELAGNLNKQVVLKTQLLKLAFTRKKLNIVVILVTNYPDDSYEYCDDVFAVVETLICANTPAQWELVCSFLEKWRKKISSENIKKLFSQALTCKNNTDALKKLLTFGKITIDVDSVNLALKHDNLDWLYADKKEAVVDLSLIEAEDSNWILANKCIEKNWVNADKLKKMALFALKQNNLTQLQILTPTVESFSEIFSDHLKNLDSKIAEPKVDMSCFYLDDEEQWQSATIRPFTENMIFIYFESYQSNNVTCYRKHSYVNQNSSAFRLSILQNQNSFNFKNRMQNCFLTATTAEDWEFVCLIMPLLKPGFDNAYLFKLFEAALEVEASDETLSFILTRMSYLSKDLALKAVKKNRSTCLSALESKVLTELFYRAAIKNVWEVVNACLQYVDKIEKQALQEVLPLAIDAQQFFIVKQLIRSGANLLDLNLDQQTMVKWDVAKVGLEVGETISIYYENSWYHSTVLHRETEIVVNPFMWPDNMRYFLARNMKKNPNYYSSFENSPSSLSLKENLKLTLGYPSTLDDLKFVIETANQIFLSSNERNEFLQSLLKIILLSQGDKDCIVYLIKQNIPLLPEHVSLSLKHPSVEPLKALLNEDKDVNCEDSLESGSYEMIHTYLDFRKPKPAVLAPVIEKVCKDPFDDYVELRKLISKMEKFPFEMQKATQICFEDAFKAGYFHIAKILLDYATVITSDDIILSVNTEWQWKIVKEYLFHAAKDTLSTVFLEKLLKLALDQKVYFVALTILQKYQLFFKIEDIQKQMAISNLFVYCFNQIDECDNLISEKPKNSYAFWGKTITSELAFIAACKLITFLLVNDNNLTACQATGLSEYDLKKITSEEFKIDFNIIITKSSSLKMGK